MLRFSLLTALLVSLQLLLPAQKPVLTISPVFKLKAGKTFEGVLYSNAGAHYLYFYDFDRSAFYGKKMSLEKYDPAFKLIWSKEYKMHDDGVRLLGMKYFQGQLLWLRSQTNKKDDYIQYSLTPVGLDGKEGKSIEVARFKYKRRKDIPDIEWNISRDSSKLMFQAVLDRDDKEEPFEIFVSVLNKNLTVDWSQNLSFPYTEEKIDLSSTFLKNDGSVHFLTRIFNGEKAKESKTDQTGNSVAAYDIAIFQFSKGSQEPKEQRLQLGGSFIKGASLATDKNDNLKCAGLYSDDFKTGTVTGMFYYNIAADGTVTAHNKKLFSKAEIEKFGDKNTDKDEDGVNQLESTFKFSNFLVRDDGSAIVVAEENIKTYVFNRRNNATGTTTSYNIYDSRDIIIFNIDLKGDIAIAAIIPKRQRDINTNVLISHVSFIDGNNVLFFYNEDKDNMDKPIENSKPKLNRKDKDYVAVMTTLAPDGTLTRQDLFASKETKLNFMPKYCIAVGKKQLFYEAIKVNDRVGLFMGTITLPD